MGILQEYFENAYICCVHYLVNKKLHLSERIFWIIAIVACLGGTYYVVSRNWFEYRDQKTMYKIETDYLNWNAPYPSVVICETMSRGITKPQRKNIEKYLDAIHYNKSLLTDDLFMRLRQLAFFAPSDVASIVSFCKNIVCPTKNYALLADQVKIKCDDFFSYCDYNGIVFDCCQEFLSVNTSYGKCFGFNNYGGRYEDGKRVQKLKWYTMRKPGKTEGRLYFELRTHHIDIYVLDPSEVPHHQNSITKYLKQLYAFNEFYYRLNIEQTVTFDEERSVEIEARACRFHNENYLKYFEFYSYANCLMECLMQTQMEICGCILHIYPVDISLHCGLENIYCASKVPGDSDCGCLPDCNTTAIHKVGTHDDKIIIPYRNSNSNISFTLDVPAPTLRYIRYSLKSSLSFVVAIGGAIGFFLGISFQSITQVFFYFFVRPITDYSRARKKQKAREKDEKMNENFRVAWMRLKLESVEKAIRKDMLEKME